MLYGFALKMKNRTEISQAFQHLKVIVKRFLFEFKWIFLDPNLICLPTHLFDNHEPIYLVYNIRATK